MRLGLAIFATILLAACGGRDDPRETTAGPAGSPDTPSVQDPAPTPADRPASTARWTLQSSDEGVALALTEVPARTAIRLFCPSGKKSLLVNVPGFRPVRSEERMSFGSRGEAVALVAGTGGDAARGGVSASGTLPEGLAAVLSGPLSVSYGAQTSGPHPVPPEKLSRSFAAACNEVSADRRERVPPASACMMQGTERLRVRPLRAVGTEPFWAARIEGRCVTYSHPEDQDGTRIWTRYQDSADGGSWTGSLGRQRFELRTRAAPGCSDGISDANYPLAVELMVEGERRTGCAQPIGNP